MRLVTATLWGIFECISNAMPNSSSNSSSNSSCSWSWGSSLVSMSWQMPRDSWSTCRIYVLRLYFLNLRCQFRMSQASSFEKHMSCSFGNANSDFKDSLLYAQPHRSTRLHSRLTGDKTKIKRNTSVLVWGFFLGLLDSFILINCQHVPRLFISKTVSGCVYKYTRIFVYTPNKRIIICK